MPIKTKRWNDPPEDDDGLRLLVCRYRPRGIPKDSEPWDAWWKDLGPSPELHADGNGKGQAELSWEQFKDRYRKEMEAQRTLIGVLSTYSETGHHLTLLCSSRCTDAARCHRSVLAELIEHRGRREADTRFPIKISGVGRNPLERFHDRILDGSFEALCNPMELRVAPGYHTIAFQGSGIVRTVPGRGFEFAFVGTGEPGFVLDLSSGANREHPDIPDEPQQYQLRGRDGDGREWVSGDWVRPSLQGDTAQALNTGRIELRGNIESLVTSDIDGLIFPPEEGECYRFIIPEPGRVHWTGWRRSVTSGGPQGFVFQDASCYRQCEVEGVHVLLEKIKDGNAVQGMIAAEGRELPPFADVQVLQALQLTTARPLYFTTHLCRGEHQRSLRLVGPVTRPMASNIPPPVWITDHSDIDSWWAVFDSFLRYLVLGELNPYFHPLIDNFLLAMDASTRHPSTYALVLSVVIEGILPYCKQGDMDDEQEVPSVETLRSLAEHMDSWQGDERMKARVQGVLSSFRSWHSKDRLRKLEGLGVITRAQVKAWQELRNKIVHGGLGEPVPELDGLVRHVISMMYALILREAGYEGPLTDYATL